MQEDKASRDDGIKQSVLARLHTPTPPRNDKTELLTLTESALEKLSTMSDEEFEKLELYPDFAS